MNAIAPTMTEDEIISALKTAGYEYELSLKESDLKYPLTLHIWQTTVSRFGGRLMGPDGLIFSVADLDAPDDVVRAANAAGNQLSFTIKIRP